MIENIVAVVMMIYSCCFSHFSLSSHSDDTDETDHHCKSHNYRMHSLSHPSLLNFSIQGLIKKKKLQDPIVNSLYNELGNKVSTVNIQMWIFKTRQLSPQIPCKYKLQYPKLSPSSSLKCPFKTASAPIQRKCLKCWPQYLLSLP